MNERNLLNNLRLCLPWSQLNHRLQQHRLWLPCFPSLRVEWLRAKESGGLDLERQPWLKDSFYWALSTLGEFTFSSEEGVSSRSSWPYGITRYQPNLDEMNWKLGTYLRPNLTFLSIPRISLLIWVLFSKHGMGKRQLRALVRFFEGNLLNTFGVLPLTEIGFPLPMLSFVIFRRAYLEAFTTL